MVFGLSDVAAAVFGLGAYAGSLHARGLLGAALDTSAVASPLWLAAGAAVAYSHLLYASVWFSPAAFVRLCARPPLRFVGPHAVAVFSALVAAAKLLQQAGWFALVARAHGGAAAALEAAAGAGAATWALAAALAACGQALNVAIYAAIGKDGVYYGFKLGRPVPWCDGFPFNLGFRHPQYVGGLLTQLGLLALASDERSLHAGLAPLAAWWVLLYVATSVQEALGDNDKSD